MESVTAHVRRLPWHCQSRSVCTRRPGGGGFHWDLLLRSCDEGSLKLRFCSLGWSKPEYYRVVMNNETQEIMNCSL